MISDHYVIRISAVVGGEFEATVDDLPVAAVGIDRGVL
jgi:hypothetical protein